MKYHEIRQFGPGGTDREGGGGEYGRRYWYRTSGLFRVKEALYP